MKKYLTSYDDGRGNGSKEGSKILDMMKWEDRIIARWEAQQERWDHGGDCFYNCVPWDCPFYNFCPFS